MRDQKTWINGVRCFILLLALLVLCFILLAADAHADTYVLTPRVESPEETSDTVTLTGDEPLVEVEEDPTLVTASMFRGASPLAQGALRGEPGPGEPGYYSGGQDGMEIHEITIRWVSKSTGETNAAGTGDLNIVPDSEEVPDHVFRIDFSLEGQDAHDAGTIEIVIPAYIWLNREGTETGKLTLAVPEEPETGADFAWRRVDDYVYITNTHRLAAATRVMVEGAFRKLNTLDLRDVTIDGTDPEISRFYGDTPGLNGYSKWLSATVNLTTTHDNEITRISNQIRADINTETNFPQKDGQPDPTKIKKTSNINYCYVDGAVTSVPTDMRNILTGKGLDEENYFYVRWYVTASAVGWQPFTLKLTDSDSSTDHGGIVLGVTGLTAYDFNESVGTDGIHMSQGTTVAAENGSATAVLYDGYTTAVRSAYVWVAYPKARLDGNDISNTVTFTLRGQDDLIIKTAEATGTINVNYYHIKKNWDYSEIGKGINPTELPDYITKPSSVDVTVYADGRYYRGYTLNIANEWTGTWFNELTSAEDYKRYSFYEAPFTPNGNKQENKAYVEDVTIDGVLGKLWYWYTESSLSYDNYDPETKTFVITNTYHQQFIPYTTYTVQKQWVNDVNQTTTTDGSNIPAARRPSSVTANIKYTNDGYTYSTPMTLSGTEWSGTWVDKGFGYTYWVTEDTVYPVNSSRGSYTREWYQTEGDGIKTHVEYWYTQSVSSVTKDEDTHTGSCTITNTYHENPIPYHDYKVIKAWDDTGVPAGLGTSLRPTSSDVTIYSNGYYYNAHDFGNEAGEYTWEDYGRDGTFRIYESDSAKVYTDYQDESGHWWRVRHWYTPVITSSEDGRTWTVTNTYQHSDPIPYTTHVYHKVWVGDDDYPARRPDTTTYRVRVYDGSTLIRTDKYEVIDNTDGTFTVKRYNYDTGELLSETSTNSAEFSVPDDGTGYRYEIYETGSGGFDVWTDDSTGITYRQQYWYTASYGDESYSSSTYTYVRTITNTYGQGRAIPYTTHAVTKAWDFGDYAGNVPEGHKPDSTRITVYRNGTITIGGDSLTEASNWYEWEDEGYDYSYTVKEAGESNGVISHEEVIGEEGSQSRRYYGYYVTYGDETWNAQTKRYERTVTNRYYQNVVPFKYYSLNKTWGDNDNEKGHRAETQWVTITERYSEGTFRRSWDVNVGTSGNPNYSWNDNGYGYTYTVTEKNGYRDGYTDWSEPFLAKKKDTDNAETWVKTRTHWIYEPGTVTSAANDSGGLDFSVPNLYREETSYQWATPLTPDELSVANRKNAANYTSRITQTSKEYLDNLINKLIRGESVVVNYNVYNYDSSTSYSSYNRYTNVLQYSRAAAQPRADYVDYGACAVTVRLEDQPTALFSFNNSNEQYALTADDYEIAEVTLYPTSMLKWAQHNDDQGNRDYFSSWYKTAGTRDITTELYGQKADGIPVRLATMVGNTVQYVYAPATWDGTKVVLPAGSGILKVYTETSTAADDTLECQVSMGYNVGVRILPSVGVLDQIEEAFQYWGDAGENPYAELRITNTSRTVVTGDEEGEQMARDSAAYSYIHGKDYRTAAVVYTKLSYDGDADSDVKKHIETVHVSDTFYQQTNVTSREDYNKQLEDGVIYSSNSGVWYDLLPIGMEPDLDTVAVSGGGEIKWKQAIPNYKGSGKTLVVVRVEYPEELRYREAGTVDSTAGPNETGLTGYRNQHTLTFDGKYTWDDIIALKFRTAEQDGVSLYHTAVFQADEEEVGNLINFCGEPDDPTEGRNQYSKTLTEGVPWNSRTLTEDKDYNKDTLTLTDLDTPANPGEKNNNINSFVYRRSTTPFNPLLAQAVAMEKLVSVDGINWVKGHADQATDETDKKAQPISVYEGDSYTYRITVAQQTNGWTNNIIIYDYLENYTVDHSESPYLEQYDGEGRWYGTLESVDLSEVRNLGCDPVLYYYIGPYDYDLFHGTDTVAPPKLTNTEYWTTAPADMSSVKGIAIDCTKATEANEDGTWDFWMKEEDVIEIFIHMRAPLMDDLTITPAEEGKEFHPKAYNNTAIRYNFPDDGQIDGYHYYKMYTQIGIDPYNVEIQKQWEDDEDRDGLRKDLVSIKFEMLANGESTDPKTYVVVKAADNWILKRQSLPMYDANGRWITYTLKEESWTVKVTNPDTGTGSEKEISPPVKSDGEGGTVPAYTMTQDSVSTDGKLSFSVTNSYTPERISVPFEKTWAGDEPEDRPASILVKLYTIERDPDTGEKLIDPDTGDYVYSYTGKSLTVTPDDEGNWTGEFRNLLKYQNHGTEILYAVMEEEVHEGELEPYSPTYASKPADASEPDGDKILTILNTYYPYGDLQVTKNLAEGATDKAKDAKFTFSLTLFDTNGEYLQDKYNYFIYSAAGEPIESTLDIKDDSDEVVLHGNGLQLGNGDEFKLKAGEYIVIKDIPTGSTYSISELYANAFTLESSAGDTGSIRSHRTQTADFVNRYSAEGKAPVSVNKKLEGREMLRGQFRFQIQDGILYDIQTTNSETGDPVMESHVENGTGELVRYATNSKPNADTASVTFSPLTYTEADLAGAGEDGKTFYYTISEVIPDPIPAGYVYDESHFYMTVTVKDEEGKGELTTSVKYYSDKDCTLPLSVSNPERLFTNSYSAEGTLQPEVWKSLRNGTLEADKFAFELLSVTAIPDTLTQEQIDAGAEQTYTYTLGERAEIKKNDADGKISFAEFTKTLNKNAETDIADGDSVYYAVREITSESVLNSISMVKDANVTYDERILLFRFTAVDNGDGTLGFNQDLFELEETAADSGVYTAKIDADTSQPQVTQPVFENEMKPGTLKVTKYTDGTGEADQTFNFRVVLTGEDLPENYQVVPAGETAPETENKLILTIGADPNGNATGYQP